MATTEDAQALLSSANCEFACIPSGLIWYAILGALITISNGGTMSTDPQVLISQARCLECLIPAGFVPYAILEALRGVSGGGSGSVTCGAGAPVAAPTGTCAIYIDTATGTLYTYYSGAWH